MPRVIGHQVGPLPYGKGPTCEYLYAQIQGPLRYLKGTWSTAPLEGAIKVLGRYLEYLNAQVQIQGNRPSRYF